MRCINVLHLLQLTAGDKILNEPASLGSGYIFLYTTRKEATQGSVAQ
jgi:hypothetical protein